jgi:hypothetical protein
MSDSDRNHLLFAIAALHDAIRHLMRGSGDDEVEKWLANARREIEKIGITPKEQINGPDTAESKPAQV